jgi:hypothetical protein
MIVAYFNVPVVLLSASDWGVRVTEGLAAGAIAHVFKSNAWEELVPALRAAVKQHGSKH